MKHLVNFLKNRIWFIAAAVLLVLLTAQGCAGLRQNAVALEQSARCGMTEHVHTGDCYMDELLVCGKSAHSHGENCYIFRVSDNDLNAILTDMGEKDIRSLEDYIAYNLAAVYGEGHDVDEYLRYASVEELNAKLSTTGAKALRLNAAADLPATYAVGDSESTEDYTANFYIYLDDAWTHIGTMNFTTPYNYWRYTRTVSTADILEFINEAVEPNYSALSDNVRLYYGTNGTNYNNSASIGGTSTTFGSSRDEDTASAAIYVRIISASGNNGSNTNLKFYTVTYYNNDGTNNKYASQIVRSGTSITAPEEPTRTGYTFGGWYTDSKCTTAYDFSSNVTGKLSLYAKWIPSSTHTVTWKNWNGEVLEKDLNVVYGTVPSYDGATPTKPSGTPGTSYSFTGWSPAIGAVTADVEYTAQFKSEVATYTVAFNSNGGSAVNSQTVEHGKSAVKPSDPTRTGYTFAGWYLGDTPYDFSTPVTGDITLTAKWTPIKYTVTYRDGDSTRQENHDYGSVITLPTAEHGDYWLLAGGGTYAEGDSYTVTGDATFTSTDKVCATYIYKDGSTDVSDAVTPGTVITLPAASSTGNVWVGSDGVTYQPGATVTLNENMTFTEKATLTVSYDVNFTTSGSGANRYTNMGGYNLYLKEDAPAIVGDSSAVVAEGETVNANSVSNMNIVVGSSSNANRFSVIHFKGWLAEDGSTLIAPGTIMDYETLARYDSDNDGTVTLTAEWYYKKAQSVDFFIIYNSRNNVEDANSVTDAAYYTGVAFSTYVGGVESDPTDSNNNYRINYDDFPADDKPSTYELDSLVRGLHGEKNEGAWLAEFPSDEAMFEYLRSNYPDNMSIEGTPIDAEDLTTDKYTIRWYKFQYVGNDGNYHIDGVLVKKEGQIYVDKVFGGIEDAVNKAKEGFYILAENGYKDANGNFVAYDENNSAYNTHVLVLDEATKTALQTQYPNATFQTYNTQDLNSDGEVDKWLITGVELGEYWRFTEYAVHPTNADGKKYSWYAEYSVTDTDGEQSAIAEFGSIAQVIGKTYALDEDPDQGLSIKFTNYYYANDSILVRKIDSGTGTPLGNAVFELWQPTTKGGESVKLRFNDDGNGVYTLSETGDKDTITTNAEGFSVITITGFSFEAGPLTVKEVSPPSGYDLVNPVTVHYLNGESGDVGVTDIDNIDPARYAEFAEYYVDERTQGGVIVVKDHTAYEAAVTVNKIWENPNYIADSVTVVLQATVNGVTQNAGALFPNLTGHQQVLSADNNWTYTWTGLPAYANGELVSWGIKEIKVGDDPTLSDGVSFASWVPSYSPASYWDSDGNGIVDSWSVSVTNSQKRPMVNIYKTDASGARVLEGATFTLERVQWNNGQWEQVPGTLTLSQTSDANGWLIFDNLTPSSAGSTAFYRLTETSPPPGYTKAAESVVFTVDGLGNIYGAADGAAGSSLLDTEYVDFYSRYYLTVRNEAMPEFPETGGDGNDIYAHLGALLMLAAAAAVIYKTKGRKEDDASVV